MTKDSEFFYTVEGINTPICVKYKQVDGWHVFSSDDLLGLYVVSQNFELAFNDVALVIQKLLKLNEGIDAKIQSTKPQEPEND